MNNNGLPTASDRIEDRSSQFCLSIISCLKSRFPEGTQIECIHLQKNNGVFKDSICIREPGVNCSPAIYIEDYYTLFSGGTKFDTIVEEIIEKYERYKKDMAFDMSNLCDYEWIKEHIGFKLVNYEKNEKMLKDIPHIPFLDLAIVAFVDVSDIMGVPSTFTVLNHHMRAWNVEKAELIKEAMENMALKTPAKLQTIMEMIDELSGGRHTKDKELPLYVLTNASENLGAGCVLYDGMLQTCAEKVGKRFYLLPSSIHELILIPCEAGRPEDLICMVRDINRTQIYPSEWLSDYIYKYDSDTKVISILDIEKEYMGYEKAYECVKINFTIRIDELLSQKVVMR